MKLRKKQYSAFVATLAVAAALAPAGSTVAPPNLSGLYFVYAMNCTFTVQNDAGNVVSSIPPGTYNVSVRTPIQFGTVPLAQMGVTDMTACKGMVQFQLNGPGIALDTTLLSGCGQDLEFTETFAPSSTYVAQDNNQPNVTRTVFTTLANGTPPPPPKIAPGGNAAATQSYDIVGSAMNGLVRGTLTAKLAPSGALSLVAANGKAVTKLKAGKYRITVDDRSAKRGLTLQSAKLGASAMLSGNTFVGKRTTTVALRAGAWTYFAGLGRVHRFVVTA